MRAQEGIGDVAAATDASPEPLLYGVEDVNAGKDASSTASSPTGTGTTKAPVSPPGPVALPGVSFGVDVDDVAFGGRSRVQGHSLGKFSGRG